MRVGLITSGGDCPGLNAVIRAVVRKGILHYGDEFVGFMEGWRGLVEGITMPLTLETTSGILHLGGTILRSSRMNMKDAPNGMERCITTLRQQGIDVLIALGGNGTQAASLELYRSGFNCIGVPKTIDNDLCGTDVCFGFDTAVEIATEAVDRLHSTAESHNRVIVCEVMGRDAGWIALGAGVAGGADVILVPEIPIDMDNVCRLLRYRWERGEKFAIVIVAEGARLPGVEKIKGKDKVDAQGRVRLGGIAEVLAEEIERLTGYETRHVNLGHIQRGGTPSANDRMLATRYGLAAIDLVHAGKFGRMVVLQGMKITDIPLADAVARTRTVDPDLLEIITGLQPVHI